MTVLPPALAKMVSAPVPPSTVLPPWLATTRSGPGPPCSTVPPPLKKIVLAPLPATMLSCPKAPTVAAPEQHNGILLSPRVLDEDAARARDHGIGRTRLGVIEEDGPAPPFLRRPDESESAAARSERPRFPRHGDESHGATPGEDGLVGLGVAGDGDRPRGAVDEARHIRGEREGRRRRGFGEREDGGGRRLDGGVGDHRGGGIQQPLLERAEQGVLKAGIGVRIEGDDVDDAFGAGDGDGQDRHACGSKLWRDLGDLSRRHMVQVQKRSRDRVKIAWVNT